MFVIVVAAVVVSSSDWSDWSDCSGDLRVRVRVQMRRRAAR